MVLFFSVNKSPFLPVLPFFRVKDKSIDVYGVLFEIRTILIYQIS